MVKPLGARLALTSKGCSIRVVTPTLAEDAVWSAVEQAIIEGWEPKQFIAEVSSCWEEQRKRDLEEELKEFRK